MKEQQMKNTSYLLALKNIAPRKFRGFTWYKLSWTHVAYFNGSAGSGFRHLFNATQNQTFNATFQLYNEAIFYYSVG